MGFLHRKLLHLSDHNHDDSPIPSPKQPPVLTLSLPFPDKIKPSFQTHHHIHIHALQILLILMVGVVLLLCTVTITLRKYYYYSRRHNQRSSSSNSSTRRRRRNTPILFHVNGGGGDTEFPVDDDDVERVVDHTIWHIRTVGFEQTLIDSITVFKYEEGVIGHGTECSVCLGEFEKEESLRLLPKCNHAFHIPCIDTWLRSHKNCPLCRAPVFRDDDSDVSCETQNQEAQVEINFDSVAVSTEFESDAVVDDSVKILVLPVTVVSMDDSSYDHVEESSHHRGVEDI